MSIEIEFTTPIRMPKSAGFEQRFSTDHGWTIEAAWPKVSLSKGDVAVEVHGIPFLLIKRDAPRLEVVPPPLPAAKPVVLPMKRGK